MTRTVVLAVVLLATWQGRAAGQESDWPPPARQQVLGQVLDSATSRPLFGVLVTALDSVQEPVAGAVTDSAGAFRLSVALAHGTRLRAERLGYERTESVPLTLVPTDTVRLLIRLRPRPLELPRLQVTARRALSNLEAFLRRREIRFGSFMGPAEIAAARPRSGDHLLALLPGIHRDISGGGVVAAQGYTFIPGMTGTTSAAVFRPREKSCHPMIYIDGRRMEFWRTGRAWEEGDGPTSVDYYIPFRSIRGVEVYDDWKDAPAQYHVGSGRSCAIVLVWTDYGFGFRERTGQPW